MGLSKADQSQLTPNAKGSGKDKTKKGETSPGPAKKLKYEETDAGSAKKFKEGETDVGTPLTHTDSFNLFILNADEKKAAKKAWKKEMKEKFLAMLPGDEGSAQKFAKDMKDKFKAMTKEKGKEKEKEKEKTSPELVEAPLQIGVTSRSKIDVRIIFFSTFTLHTLHTITLIRTLALTCQYPSLTLADRSLKPL